LQVFIPLHGWRTLKRCVWEAPFWYKHHYVLSGIEEYRSLQHFFVDKLGLLPKPTTEHYLEYLETLKADPLLNKQKVLETAGRIYGSLALETGSNRSLHTISSEELQERFEDDQLIYDSKSNSWFKSTDCIWAEERIRLPKMFSMAEQYREHKDFFLKTIKVEEPRLDMHIVALKQKAAQAFKTRDEIHQIIVNICQFNPSSRELEQLADCACFPVVSSSGSESWTCSTGVFAISDRAEYWRLFKGKIDLLNFTLEEVHAIEVFLRAMGQRSKYMSQSVEFRTKATGGVKDDKRTATFNRKAYAICRYTAHSKSMVVMQSPLEYYQMFQTAVISTSDNISKTVIYRQGSKAIPVEVESANCHLEENDGDLEICLPRNPRREQIALVTDLPLALLKHLGISCDGPKELGSILSASNLAVVDAILEQSGVININGINRPPDEDADEDLFEETSNGLLGLSLQDQTPGRSSSTQSGFGSSRLSSPPSSIFSNPSPGGGYRTPGETYQNAYQSYKELLETVVSQARAIGDIPRFGYYIDSQAPNLSSEQVEAGLGDTSSRNFKIGAAGELFVSALKTSS
jgi:hypothetical protein